MARGKASVQLYDDAQGDVGRMIDGVGGLATLPRELDTRGVTCNPGAEDASPEPGQHDAGAEDASPELGQHDAGDEDVSPELGQHIVGQLRVAYDGLLSEPIPDHLRKLLDDLCKAEGRS